MVLELRVGDVVRLKKPHPCGSFEWRVFRLGADIGLRCLRCQHPIMLERRLLERRVRAILPYGQGPGPDQPSR